MATIQAPGESLRVQDIDESTRLLCAGAHLDRDFADAAVAEFLTQPLRSLPPSPGVNPQAVLRECLAARRRRRIRDTILFALVAVYGLIAPSLLFGWILAAVGWRIVGPKQRRLDQSSRGAGDGRAIAGAVGALVLLLALGFVITIGRVLLAVTKGNDGGGYYSGYSSGYDGFGSGSSLSPWAVLAMGGVLLLLPLALSLGALGVLWYDRRAVHAAMINRFRRGRFTSTPPTLNGGLDNLLWGTGYSRYSQNLRNLDAEHVNCVVYRGSHPFVGSGAPESPWSIAIALEPARNGLALLTGEPVPQPGTRGAKALSIIGLHTEVTREVARLGGETSLSPSRRLAAVRTEGMAFIPARCLAQHLDAPELREVIADRRRRPNPQVSGELLQHVAACPQEWMRYYATYIVESWDREVTVSMLMHYGLDDRNLYIECTPCVLRPVDPRYRAVDELSERSASAAFLDALGSWTVLPLTILPRFLHAVRRVKDPFEGSDSPERLGVAFSLREIAAANRFTDYAQLTDANRYLQILQTRIIRAVGTYLEECGLSAVDFMRQADAVTVDTVIHGDVTNSMVGGRGNRLTVTVPRPPGPGKA